MKLWMSIWCQVLFVRLEASRYLTSGYLKPQCFSNIGIKLHNNCVVILTVKVKRIVQLGRNSLFHVVCLFFQNFLTLMNIDRQVTVGIKLMVFIFCPPTIICDSGRILPCEVAIHNPRRRMHIVLTCEWRYPLIGPDQEKIQSPMRPAYRAEKFQLSKRNR